MEHGFNIQWCQLILFASVIGGKYLQQLIDHLCNQAQKSFGTFIESSKHTLLHLWKDHQCCRCNRDKKHKTGKLSEKQIDYLLQRSNTCTFNCPECYNTYGARDGISTQKLDVTLSCTLIHLLSPKQALVSAVKQVKNIRNEVAHMTTEDQANHDFSDSWKKLEAELKTICQHLPGDNQELFKRLDDDIEEVCRIFELTCGKCTANIEDTLGKLCNSVSHFLYFISRLKCLSFLVLEVLENVEKDGKFKTK